jgi:hypothetical protein
MKKILLTGVAALFLAIGMAHADDKLPEAMLGRWCSANVRSDVRMIFYRPSFVGREYCTDFDDGITIEQTGFSDDRPSDDLCDGYVFDKIERIEDGYLVSAHCEKAGKPKTILLERGDYRLFMTVCCLPPGFRRGNENPHQISANTDAVLRTDALSFVKSNP